MNKMMKCEFCDNYYCDNCQTKYYGFKDENFQQCC